jgi:hypothetical protein
MNALLELLSDPPLPTRWRRVREPAPLLAIERLA